MPRNKITYSQNPTHAARSAHAKGDKAFRTYDTSYIRPKRNPIPAVIALVIVVVALIAIVVGVLGFTRSCAQTHMLEPGVEAQVVVVEGEGAKSVAKSLLDAGLISDTGEFVDRFTTLEGDGTLQPGTYTLKGGQSIDEIIATLQTPVAADTFTIPEGSTIAQTAEIVAKATNGRITAEEFSSAAYNAAAFQDSYDFLQGVRGNSLEGFLFPKTYPFSDDSTADSLIRAMLDQFATETQLLDWSYPESQGLTHYDAVTLASIVEKEADAAHRATVASVFYNRMAVGMQLQSDATVAYAVGRDPTPEDIATYNDYNTYMYTGLTPTPINSPSLECLQAVCQPEKTGYYYFYFEPDGKGGMNYMFSETYEEHRATYE